MANFVQINAAGTAVLYEPDGKTQVNAAGTAVLYEPDGKTQVSAVGLVVLYSLQPDVTGVQANAVGLVTLYSDIPPGHRVFPIPPSQRSLQSQIGKRKFPIVQ